MTQAFLAPLLQDLATAEEFVASFAAGANGGGYGTGYSAGVEYISSPDVGVSG